jgi:hypothetical protein
MVELGEHYLSSGSVICHIVLHHPRDVTRSHTQYILLVRYVLRILKSEVLQNFIMKARITLAPVEEWRMEVEQQENKRGKNKENYHDRYGYLD